MATIVNESLQRIAKGSFIIIGSTVFGLFFAFIGRLLIARYYTQEEYGLFAQALVILNIAAVFAVLGLREGAPRQIAYFQEKDKQPGTQGIIASSLQFPLIISSVFTIGLYFASDSIADHFFHDPAVATAIRILAISLPFFVVIQMLSAIFRGYSQVKPKAYFEDIVRNVLFLALLILIIVIGASFSYTLYAFTASMIVTCFGFMIYGALRLPYNVAGLRYWLKFQAGWRELLLFSLPLMATMMLNMVMTWTDTIMLGYYKTSAIVGLYNAAFPIALFLLSTPLVSMAFIYSPIATELISKNLMLDMKRTYTIVTKWVFSLTIPVFAVIFLFPEVVIRIFFGVDYIEAATALRILSLGLFIHTVLGPNSATMIALGKPKVVMWTALIATIANIILNIALIPSMGIDGAAIASASSLALVNIMNSVILYSLCRAHPFTRKYIKPIVVCAILVVITYMLISQFFEHISLWLLPAIFVLLVFIYGISLILTRSFDDEDITLLTSLGDRLGTDMQPIVRIFRKFT